MSDLRIGLLCNNLMAVPAMQALLAERVLCGVATAGKDWEVARTFRDAAAIHNIPYHKISRKDAAGQLELWLADTRPDIVFVMTFPWKIPVSVLNIPRLGFFNFHYGLLPGMRGADPIFESIRQRRPSAGTTVHVMTEDFDAGPIVMREEVPLPADYTYGILSSQMAQMGGRMCAQIISDLKENKTLATTQQDEREARYWPRIGESELQIRWKDMEAAEITALVRSCNPIAKGVPAGINGWKIGISDVSEINLEGDASAIVPGTILAADMQNGLIVCCKNSKALKLEVIYTAEGYFPGYKLGHFGIAAGMVFGS